MRAPCTIGTDSSSGQGQSGECDSDGQDPAHECLLGLKIARAMRGVTPALSACRRPLHRRLAESGKASCSPQQSPVTETLALGRPQIPAQLSAPVRPGGSLTEAKCWAVRFPEGRGGRPAPTEPNKNEIDRRKVVVGALKGALASTSCESERVQSRSPAGAGLLAHRLFRGYDLVHVGPFSLCVIALLVGLA